MLQILQARLSKYQNLRKVLENTAWLFADKVVRAFAAFLVGVAFARIIGPDLYGVYNYTFAVIVILAPLVALGIDEIVIRDLIEWPKEKDQLLGSALGLKLFGGLGLILISLIYALFLHRNDTLILILLLIFGVGTLTRSMEVADLWFQSQMDSRSAIVPRTIIMLFATLLKIGALLSPQPVINFAICWGLELGLGGIFTLLAFRRKAGDFLRWRASREVMLRLMKQGWPLMLSVALVNLYLRLDQVLLKWWVSAHELGIYASAVRLIEVWYFVPVVITAGLFPSVVRSKSLHNGEYETRIQALYDIVIWLGIGFALAMQIIAPLVVRLFLGEKFAEAVPILKVYSLLGLSIFFMQARLKWLAIEGRLGDILAVEALTLVGSAAMNFYSIPKFGGMGAAWSAFFSAAFGNLIAAFFYPSIRESLKMYGRSLLLPFRLLGAAAGKRIP